MDIYHYHNNERRIKFPFLLLFYSEKKKNKNKVPLASILLSISESFPLQNTFQKKTDDSKLEILATEL